MSGKEMPSSYKKPPRSIFSRAVRILFIVAFIVVIVLLAMVWLMLSRPDSARMGIGDASAPQQGVEIGCKRANLQPAVCCRHECCLPGIRAGGASESAPRCADYSRRGSADSADCSAGNRNPTG